MPTVNSTCGRVKAVDGRRKLFSENPLRRVSPPKGSEESADGSAQYRVGRWVVLS